MKIKTGCFENNKLIDTAMRIFLLGLPVDNKEFLMIDDFMEKRFERN